MLENYVSLTESKEIDEEDLENISGGIGKLGTKMASVALSALTLVPVFTSLAGAASGNKVLSESAITSVASKEKSNKFGKFKKADNIFKKHSRIFKIVGISAAVVLGVAAGATGTVLAVKHHNNSKTPGSTASEKGS